MPKTSRTEHYRREVSRVEGFSDAVFAFAVTLLVVSLDVPKTFDELWATMLGFPAFAVSFALLFMIWWRHYRFFRRYDLEDTTVIALTGVLLFVVLFYVYPLKFVWFTLFAQIARRAGHDALPLAQVPRLFEIYGVGAAAVYGILAALYAHAYAMRSDLNLTPAEVVETREDISSNAALAGIGLLSAVVAAVTGVRAPRLVGLTAGSVYFLIPVSEWIVGAYHGRLKRRMTERA